MTWHREVAFDDSFNSCQVLTKGRALYVTGKSGCMDS